MFLKIASRSAKNKRLFTDIEAGLGRPMTWKEKAHAIQARNGTVAAQNRLQPKQQTAGLKYYTNKGLLWRCAAAACITIAVCLSIMLPITLTAKAGGGSLQLPSVGPPAATLPESPIIEPPTQERFISHFPLPFNEKATRKVDGLLLFKDSAEPDPQIIWVNSIIEIAEKAPVVLSYVLREAYIYNDAGEVAWFKQRIRTYKNYDFMGYYDEFYATLEAAHNENYEAVLNGEESFTIEKVCAPYFEKPKTKITLNIIAFIVEEVVVFCYEGQGSTIAYFKYGEFEYFIEIVELAFPVDLNFIKTGFMEVLLLNPLTGAETE